MIADNFMSAFNKRILILFGSETGNAEEVSYNLNNSLRTLYNCHVSSIDEYDHTNLPEESLVIFIVSTTGDGDLPVSMKSFWNFLMRKSHSTSSLIGLQFSVFGLGDSSYDKFNFVSRKLQARLKQLGGSEFLTMGLGDDQAKYSYFTAFNTWSKQLQEYLSSQTIFSTGASLFDKAQGECYSVTVVGQSPETDRCDELYSDLNSGNNHSERVYCSTVTSNCRITSEGWHQDVRNLSLGDVRALRASEGAGGSSDTLYLPGELPNYSF